MLRDEFERWFNEQQSLITSERKQAMLAQSRKQRPGKSLTFTISFLYHENFLRRLQNVTNFK